MNFDAELDADFQPESGSGPDVSCPDLQQTIAADAAPTLSRLLGLAALPKRDQGAVGHLDRRAAGHVPGLRLRWPGAAAAVPLRSSCVPAHTHSTTLQGHVRTDSLFAIACRAVYNMLRNYLVQSTTDQHAIVFYSAVSLLVSSS